MAELKWTNINDAGANSALSNYLTANQGFRASLLNIGNNLKDFTDTMNAGDANVKNTIKDRNTQMLLNRMAQIESPEQYQEFINSNATDANNLIGQYGGFIDLNKINKARDSLAKDVYNRALNVNNQRDFTKEAMEAKIVFNQALASGDASAAKQAYAKLASLESLTSATTDASSAYGLVKDNDARHLKGIENVSRYTDAHNQAILANDAATQALVQKQEDIRKSIPNLTGEVTPESVLAQNIDPTIKQQLALELQGLIDKQQQAASQVKSSKAMLRAVEQHFNFNINAGNTPPSSSNSSNTKKPETSSTGSSSSSGGSATANVNVDNTTPPATQQTEAVSPSTPVVEQSSTTSETPKEIEPVSENTQEGTSTIDTGIISEDELNETRARLAALQNRLNSISIPSVNVNNILQPSGVTPNRFGFNTNKTSEIDKILARANQVTATPTTSDEISSESSTEVQPATETELQRQQGVQATEQKTSDYAVDKFLPDNVSYDDATADQVLMAERKASQQKAANTESQVLNPLKPQKNEAKLNPVINTVRSINKFFKDGKLIDGSPRSFEEFRDKLSKDKYALQDFIQADSVTDGAISRYAQEMFSTAGGGKISKLLSTYQDTVNQAKSNHISSYTRAKLDGQDPETTSIVGAALQNPQNIIKVGDITITSDTSQESKASNKQALYEVLSPLASTQGYVDGNSTYFKVFGGLDGFRKKIGKAIDDGADATMIYAGIQKMNKDANGEELSMNRVDSFLDVLVKEQDNIPSWKEQARTAIDNFDTVSNDVASAFKFATDLETQTDVKLPIVLDEMQKLGLPLAGYFGEQSQTKEQQVNVESQKQFLSKKLYDISELQGSKAMQYAKAQVAQGKFVPAPFSTNTQDIAKQTEARNKALDKQRKAILNSKDPAVKKAISIISKNGTNKDKQWLKEFFLI